MLFHDLNSLRGTCFALGQNNVLTRWRGCRRGCRYNIRVRSGDHWFGGVQEEFFEDDWARTDSCKSKNILALSQLDLQRLCLLPMPKRVIESYLLVFGCRIQPAESGEDATSEIMRRVLKTSYLRADKEFISPKTAPQSGSTGATVVLFGRRLFAANVGDSRVVLARKNGACLELTSDHKPSRPDEAARVRAAGGFILHKRVMGELAITRAFGDKSFKMGIKAMLEEDADELGGAGGVSDDATKDLTAPLVSAEPEIASIVLSHDDEFLLLACDGLFDVFKSQDAITFARQELIAHRGEPAEVARILSDQAIRVRRSRDNVSILIIVLRPFWEDSPEG